jgi:uncharacterized protein YxeA
MKKLLIPTLIVVLTLIMSNLFSQETQDDFAPFLASTTKNIRLREEPDSLSNVKLTIPKNSQIYVFTSNDVEGYIKVIDIKTNKLGWIRKNSFKKIKDLPLSTSNYFQENDEITSSSPEIEITNKSSKSISLIAGSKYISLEPHSTITETVESGDLYYTASAPGVTPVSGKHNFKIGRRYSWTFAIITTRSRY